MATIALRMPTTLPGQAILPNGQCYVLMQRGPMSTREIIKQKVLAELRKARAGGMNATALPLLVTEGSQIFLEPALEEFVIGAAQIAFLQGLYLLLCDGKPLVELDEMVELTRTTQLLFVHVPAACVPVVVVTELANWSSEPKERAA